MRKHMHLFGMSSLLLLAAAGPLLAQQGVVLKELQLYVPAQAIYSLLPEGADMENEAKLADTLLQLPFEKLAAAAALHSGTEGEEKTTIYLQGKKVRIDMQTPTGRLSTILDKERGVMYNIIWDQKKYIEMSMQQIQQMRKGVQESLQQMPEMGEMETMLEKLPPEARKQAMQALKQAREAASGQQKAPAPKRKVTRTGRKRQINGFACEEVRVAAGPGRNVFWVSKARPRLTKSYAALAEVWKDGFGFDEKEPGEVDPFEVVPDAVPVETRSLQRTGGMSFELNATQLLSAEIRQLPADTFSLPPGFTPGSMMDLMNLQRDRRE